MEDMKSLQQQQQERERGIGGVIRQQSQQQQQQLLQENPQPQQPQKCPRCESLNTKFCYYNNYSLSQPRYFCKACRRYWTQGGTLRNVPVGGGCRKGKKTTKKTSSSSASYSENDQQNQNLTKTSAATINAASSSQIPSLMAATATHPSSLYYSSDAVGSGFLSSLAAFQSFNQVPINATTNGSDPNIGVSNLALLQGFSLPSFQQLHHHQHHPSQIPNMGIIKEDKPILPLEGNLILPNRPTTSHHHHPQEWLPLNFNTINPITSEGVNYWGSLSNTTTTNNNNNISTTTTTSSTGTTLNPSSSSTHHWSNIGSNNFGATPPSSSSSPSLL